ncbi:MAG: G-D-S-L family lipolytic protein [Christensenellaceae bacterium]|nr:G-D-S-L family lipolytic protein [Christensenellaceae bacterium]
MLERSEQYNILCFGDSNTWGFDAQNDRRFPRKIRWTGVLAKELGKTAYIWENGVGGRTTVFDDPVCPERCSINYLSDSLRSTMPLDLVVLNLGLNDTKVHLNTTPLAIASGIELLIQKIQDPSLYVHGASIPKILLCSPIILRDDVAERCPLGGFDAQSVKKCSMLQSYYADIAKKYGCYFLNSAEYAIPGDYDGIHLDENGHKSLGTAVANLIKQIFST